MPENRLKRVAVLIVVLFLLTVFLKHSFYLRSIGYDHIPDTHVILDERTHVWQGLSIRSSGIPAAWSSLGAYKENSFGGDVVGFNIAVDQKSPRLFDFVNYPKPVYIYYPINLGVERGIKHISLVQPYFDHPPFGGLVLSSFVSSHVKTFTDLTAWEFRKGSLWMATLTAILIFILGWQIFKIPIIGLIATLIYGTVPTFLLLSRYALLENVLTPLMLLTVSLIIFAKRVYSLKSGFWLNPKIIIFSAGVVSGLAALTKITGWSILIIGLLLLRFLKVNFKDSLFFIIPSIFLGSLFFAWGLFLSPKLFWDVLYYQAIERGFVGSLNFLISATGVGILNFPFDGWWIGGFLFLGIMMTKKEYMPLTIAAVTSLLTALFLGGANYPWYFIPLIPFMCLSIAYFLWQTFNNPSFIDVLAFFLIFFSSSFHWGYGIYKALLESTNYQHPFALYRLFFIVFLSFSLSAPFLIKRKKFRYIWIVFATLVFLLTFYWNVQSFYFILSHWGKLPSLYTPGTF